jgi:uncharacterized protein (DUF1499 family)
MRSTPSRPPSTLLLTPPCRPAVSPPAYACRHLRVLAAALVLAAPAWATAAGGGEDLGCALPTNCVSSVESGRYPPLRFEGDAAQAVARLDATLATFAEAQWIGREPLRPRALFTTRLGFQDEVDFRIDPATGRIDYRSRSRLGLFDFWKNGSRMREFAARFEAQGGR